MAVFQNQIRKDSIVKTLNKAINPSKNTNPFNHDTSYIKLYNSVKDGTRDMNEYGQLINPRYLDDVFNFKTSLSPLTRKVRVDLGRKENATEIVNTNNEKKPAIRMIDEIDVS